MSFEDRIRGRIVQTADRLSSAAVVDVESARSSVIAAAERRQKMRAVALAAAVVVAIAALSVSDNLGELLSTDEILPQPANKQDVPREDTSRREKGFSFDLRGSERATGPGQSGNSSDKENIERGRRAVTESDPRPTNDRIAVSEEPGAKRADHTETKDYRVVEPVTDATACWASRVCPDRVEFQARRTDRWVSITIQDANGEPHVYATIFFDRDGRTTEICTSTEEPLRIPRGTKVEVSVFGAGCPNDGTVTGRPTYGVVVAHFTS